MPFNDGTPIDENAQFDLVMLKANEPHEITALRLYTGSDEEGWIRVAQLWGDKQITDMLYWDLNDPEIAEINRRIRAGICPLRFGPDPPGITYEELVHVDWTVATIHPFGPRDMHLFFENLADHGSYHAAADGMPQRFRFPGIVEDATRRWYKREDGADTPDIRDAMELEAEGWVDHVPYGPYNLYAIDVLETDDGPIVSTTQRLYRRRADQDAAIVAVARAWHRYWRNLTSSEQGINTRITMRKHVEHAIGRMWADRPNESAIDVFYEGRTDSRERNARDAEDWMLGDQERWALDLGYPALALALSQGSNRSILETELGDYTFCHINEDGSIADRLSNGADGITQATWDAYQDTHYPAAVNHGVEGLAVESLTIVVHQGETETAQLVATGGLAPHVFELAFPPAWASIDAATGEITVAPDATVAAENHTLGAKVTDDLGTVVTLSVTVTVSAPSEE